jgi:hypothetical protein
MTAEYLYETTYPARAGDVALVHAGAGGVGLLLSGGNRLTQKRDLPGKAEKGAKIFSDLFSVSSSLIMTESWQPKTSR